VSYIVSVLKISPASSSKFSSVFYVSLWGKYIQFFVSYRVIEKSLCTWWLQYKKHAKIQNFKQFQSRTMVTQLELGITDGVSVSLVSPCPCQ